MERKHVAEVWLWSFKVLAMQSIEEIIYGALHPLSHWYIVTFFSCSCWGVDWAYYHVKECLAAPCCPWANSPLLVSPRAPYTHRDIDNPLGQSSRLSLFNSKHQMRLTWRTLLAKGLHSLRATCHLPQSQGAATPRREVVSCAVCPADSEPWCGWLGTWCVPCWPEHSHLGGMMMALFEMEGIKIIFTQVKAKEDFFMVCQ